MLLEKESGYTFRILVLYYLLSTTFLFFNVIIEIVHIKWYSISFFFSIMMNSMKLYSYFFHEWLYL